MISRRKLQVCADPRHARLLRKISDVVHDLGATVTNSIAAKGNCKSPAHGGSRSTAAAASWFAVLGGATVLRLRNQTLSIKQRKDTLRPVAPPTPNGDPASPSELIHLVSADNSIFDLYDTSRHAHRRFSRCAFLRR
jgi:hypothetical protein